MGYDGDMKEKTPFTQFDLPRVHLSEYGNHYRVPVSTQDAGGEISVLTKQFEGLAVTRAAIEVLSETGVDDDSFTLRLLAASALNSAWYTYGRDDTIMRRRAVLPQLAKNEPEGLWHEDRRGLEMIIDSSLLRAMTLGGRYSELRKQYLHNETTRRELGKTMLATSLSLACLDVVETTRDVSAYIAQFEAREVAIRTLTDARDFGTQIGTYPSMAQVGNEASELMLYVRRAAPQASRMLFETAIERTKSECMLSV